MSQYPSIQDRLRAIQAQSSDIQERLSGHLKSLGEANLAAGVTGYVSGRMGGPGGYKIADKVPLELGVGILALGGSLVDSLADYEDDLLAVAMGSTSGYTARQTFERGVKAHAEKRQQQGQQGQQGQAPPPGVSGNLQQQRQLQAGNVGDIRQIELEMQRAHAAAK